MFKYTLQSGQHICTGVESPIIRASLVSEWWHSSVDFNQTPHGICIHVYVYTMYMYVYVYIHYVYVYIFTLIHIIHVVLRWTSARFFLNLIDKNIHVCTHVCVCVHVHIV